MCQKSRYISRILKNCTQVKVAGTSEKMTSVRVKTNLIKDDLSTE